MVKLQILCSWDQWLNLLLMTLKSLTVGSTDDASSGEASLPCLCPWNEKWFALDLNAWYHGDLYAKLDDEQYLSHLAAKLPLWLWSLQSWEMHINYSALIQKALRWGIFLPVAQAVISPWTEFIYPHALAAIGIRWKGWKLSIVLSIPGSQCRDCKEDPFLCTGTRLWTWSKHSSYRKPSSEFPGVMDLFSRSFFPGESFCYVNEDFMPEFLCRRQHRKWWMERF